MKKKKGKPELKAKKLKKKKIVSEIDSVEDKGEDSFGSVTVIKAGATLSTLLLAQKANGMVGDPIY